MQPLTDATMGVVEYAMRALTQRAETTAHNISNISTPGFRATKVEFEAALASALRTGGPAPTPSVVDGGGLPNENGNTVDLASEMTAMVKNTLMQNAMVNAHNFKTSVLRTAITGR
jgi:flagellar basal-body rod protein FlgB